jgi:two-component system nitrogen regulation sensor histidine kinase GlnL
MTVKFVRDQKTLNSSTEVVGYVPVDEGAILAALPNPLIVIDENSGICFANSAAEQFFAAGFNVLTRQKLSDLLPFGHPLLALVAQLRLSGASSLAEYDLQLSTPRTGPRQIDVQLAALHEQPGRVLIIFDERTIAQRMNRQLMNRGVGRSVIAMAQVLAHEVKNPLSGIRGAAQLLEQNANDADRDLTRLICDEADRIVKLVSDLESFGDQRAPAREPVNIHEVLDHVRRVARSGFARNVRIIQEFDPSLPQVPGDRDQLIQVFLNLVKNAAEAVPHPGGEIVMVTAYRHSVRVAVGASSHRLRLPLEVSIKDNGPGVPDDLKPHLFDPFITTKPSGTGLGLALVAKIIGDHGGVIECESEARRTVFRVLLPVVNGREGR